MCKVPVLLIESTLALPGPLPVCLSPPVEVPLPELSYRSKAIACAVCVCHLRKGEKKDRPFGVSI